jgi:hypothetical protein
VNPHRFLKNALKLEKKKLILPSLIVLTLSISIIGGLYLRDVSEYDENLFGGLKETDLETQRLSIERNIYANQSFVSNLSEREFYNYRSEQLDEIEGKYMDKLKDHYNFFYTTLPVLYSLNTPLIPLTPSNSNYLGLRESKDEGVLYTRDNGYVISKHAINYYSSIIYYQNYMYSNYANLSKKPDLKEFRDFVSDLKNSQELNKSQKREVIDLIKGDHEERDYEMSNKTVSYGSAIGFYRNPIPDRDKYLNNKITEVKFFHFIPSLIATFILYYLISGFLIELVRTHLSKLNRLGYEDGSFFRANLTFSIPSSLFLALIITLFIGSISGGYGDPVEILAITSIPVIAGFGILSYFLKQFDGRAWIISGIALGFTPIILGLPTFVPVILALSLGLITQIGHHHVHKLSFFDDSLEN